MGGQWSDTSADPCTHGFLLRQSDDCTPSDQVTSTERKLSGSGPQGNTLGLLEYPIKNRACPTPVSRSW